MPWDNAPSIRPHANGADQVPTGATFDSTERHTAIASTAFLLGCVTIILGGLLGLIGFGFANPSPCGTGATAVMVGLWSVFAFRGLRLGRGHTLIGLSLAWFWLAVRIGTTFSKIAGSALVMGLLLPGLTVPLGVAWAILLLVFAALMLKRLWNLRQRRKAGAIAGERSFSNRQAVRAVILLTTLVIVTWLAPRAAAYVRGEQIAKLAKHYPLEAGKPAPIFGACTGVFLGYELTQHHGSDSTDGAVRRTGYDLALGDAEAELDSIVAAGARYVRMGASGDQLLENKPEQEAVDDRFMAAVKKTGLKTVLVDTQHPQVLRNHKLDWTAFCKFQRDRINYYTRRYRPDVYFVVCEPLSYHRFCLTPETSFSADAWAAQLSEMCRLVKSINPATRTGICVLVGADNEREWDVWTRMKSLPQLDILSVEIYSPDDFARTEDRLRKYGRPQELGKAFWIAETFNGWALGGGRREDQDAAWLEVADHFARHVGAETVLVWTFGTFVPGGSFLDIGSGRLNARWESAGRLSEVGLAFKKLATAGASGGNSNQ